TSDSPILSYARERLSLEKVDNARFTHADFMCLLTMLNLAITDSRENLFTYVNGVLLSSYGNAALTQIKEDNQ
ncbi:argininosuccinate synthase, partial [Bordetella holmesii]|nr:argininosuccinate synthase [Bordetella holmesii]